MVYDILVQGRNLIDNGVEKGYDIIAEGRAESDNPNFERSYIGDFIIKGFLTFDDGYRKYVFREVIGSISITRHTLPSDLGDEEE